MKKMLKIWIFAGIASIVMCGCSLNIASSNNTETMLWRALDNNNFELAKEAVEQGADINLFSNKGHYERTSHSRKIYNPVLVALVKGEFNIAEYLIKCGADVNFFDDKGESLLQYCAEDYPKALEMVIDAGANLEYISPDGRDVLDYAINYSVNNNDKTAFDILIKYGAKPTLDTANKLIDDIDVEKYGMLRTTMMLIGDNIDRCLFAAFTGDDSSVLQYINETEYKALATKAVAAFCKSETLKKIKPQSDTEQMSELLKISVMYDNKSVVRYIIDNYENAKLADENRDILYYAAKHDDVELIDIIYKSNVPYDISQALLNVIEFHNNNVLEYLLDSGISPNSFSLFGPLISTACECNNEKAVLMLIDRGANINGAYDGDPLSNAVKNGNINIAKILIDNGANVNGKNSYPDGSGGKSVLMTAVESGQLECVKLLVENGADILYEDDGINALDMSKSNGSQRIYEYLMKSINRG